MEFIITNTQRKEVGLLEALEIDIDIGETDDFEYRIEAESYESWMTAGCVIFTPDDEFGGEIGRIKSSTELGTVSLCGDTWRGKMQKKIIQPAAGQDYKIVSGELNQVLGQLVDKEFGDLFRASSINTGITVNNYQFNRYCTLMDGINAMLASVGYKPRIRYIQEERGTSGYVEVSAVEIVDWSESLEISQDSEMSYNSNLKFTTDNIMNGINHLICLGKGDLKDRLVVHLYVDKNGKISRNQTFKGNNDRQAVYDYSSADSEETLVTEGTKRLLELMDSKNFGFDADDLEVEVDIGDMIGGQDYITGFKASKPVAHKIYRFNDSEDTIQYKLEGDEIL